MKSQSGCWTCRLRRKKCDEQQPVCNACSSLLITCHYSQDKPEWLDGGERQALMTERLKQEVKSKAPFRFREPAIPYRPDSGNPIRDTTGHMTNRTQPPHSIAGSDHSVNQNGQWIPTPLDQPPRIDISCSQARKVFGEAPPLEPSDFVLISHFLDHVFPYLFPFYRPTALQGGTSWILQMALSSTVLRQSATCQSSFFLSLAQEASNQDVKWEAMLSQTNEVFGAVRQALQILEKSNFSEHVHGTARLIAALLHWQHFELAIVSFDSWRIHLNAALSFFEGLMNSARDEGHGRPGLSFTDIMQRVGPPTKLNHVNDLQVPSAEQAAFRFSTALLIFQDVIASTVLRTRPLLYGYYDRIFGNSNDHCPPLAVEDVIGCHKSVLLCISEMAVLDVWKNECQELGSLDVIELVRRATVIKDQLESFILLCENHETTALGAHNLHSGLLAPDSAGETVLLSSQHFLVTRVWAHAALLYLGTVVSGWQPENVETRQHVSQVLELLSSRFPEPAMVRTMMWPFCVAGCLANPPIQCSFRNQANSLLPRHLYKTAGKALEIMEDVWSRRASGRCMPPDLSACFRHQDTAFLLI